jgi:hypothetical protein
LGDLHFYFNPFNCYRNKGATMKERPILFNGAMVRAILDGSKTQTRRVVKPQPKDGWAPEVPPVMGRITSPHSKRGKFGVFLRRGLGTDFPEIDLIPCPYGQPGDRLWVQESFAFTDAHMPRYEGSIEYRADNKCFAVSGGNELVDVPHRCDPQPFWGPWKPSIHMPRWASRITLEIVSIRAERLNEISRGDAMAEGCPFANMRGGDDPREWFKELWKSIYGSDSWGDQLVWVVELRRLP